MAFRIRFYGSHSKKEELLDLAYVGRCVDAAEIANREVFRFYRKYPEFTVKLFYSRTMYDREMKRKTPRWEHCSTSKRCIAIFAPSAYERETTQRLRIYRKTLMHEVSHVFYMQAVGAFTPLWLLEGLAMNTEKRDYAREFKWNGSPKVEFLFFAKHPKDDGETKEFYRSSYLMTKALIKRMGIRYLMALLLKYSQNPVRVNYERLFVKRVIEEQRNY